MALKLDLDAFKALPAPQKAAIIAIPAILLLAAFFFYVFSPKKAEISALQQQIAQINNDININQAKARRLDELKRENQALSAKLALLQEQLPPAAEVPTLLRQVSDLGIKTGLDFKLWKPGASTPGQCPFYVEIPVEVEVAGGYHAVGLFFDRIGKLHRLVNVSGLKMSGAKSEKDRLMIQTTFRATAYALVEVAPTTAGGQAPSSGCSGAQPAGKAAPGSPKGGPAKKPGGKGA